MFFDSFGVKVIHPSTFLLSLYLSEIHYTHLITIPVELDFQVTGVEGDLVPSPRIFLAGGPLASSQVRFLLVPVTCLASGVFSAFGSSSWVGTSSAGVTTGTTGGTTASQHWHTVCNSGRRSCKEHTVNGVNHPADFVSPFTCLLNRGVMIL